MGLSKLQLIDVLRQHPSVAARMYAARQLSTGNMRYATSALIDALADGSAAVRRQAALALHRRHWEPTTHHDAALFFIALGEWDRCVALGSGAVNRLIAVLHDQQAAVRWNAAKSLGRIADERATTPLIVTLQHDQDTIVQRRAIEALQRIGTPRALHAVDEWYRITF